MTGDNYDDWDGSERRESIDRWHIAKEVPLAVLLMLMMQTAGGIWWLAQLSAKIDNAISRIGEFAVERYTKEDARRDRELVLAIVDQLRQKDSDQDRRIQRLEQIDTAKSASPRDRN